MSTGYRLEQRFRYTYDAPAHDLVHRLVVLPPTLIGDQRLLHGDVKVSDPRARVSWDLRRPEAQACIVRLTEVPPVLELTVTAELQRGEPEQVLPAGLLWSAEARRTTALTRPDRALRELARSLGCGDPLTLAERACSAVHQRVTYTPGVTGVRTTAAEALALGAGVCQDQAHVMLTLCRLLDVPSRYVSGHLVGQGGTHAWVQVLVPGVGGARAVALDPCHDRPADDGYVTVAVGADYADVRPTAGWYRGSARSRLSSTRAVSSWRLVSPGRRTAASSA